MNGEVHQFFHTYPHCTAPRFGLVKRVPHLVILFGTMSRGLGGTLLFIRVHGPRHWITALTRMLGKLSLPNERASFVFSIFE